MCSKKAEDLNLRTFNMITEKINQKQKQSIHHANVNVNSMVEKVIKSKAE